MFEKEANEYRNHNTNYYECDDFCADDGEAIEEAYQKGATDGYNKANEWHDLRKNPDDLPKDSVRVLVLTEERNMADVVYIPHEGFKDPDFSNWYTAIAWIEKEKIFPKESE